MVGTQVELQLTFNGIDLISDAALNGAVLACLPLDQVEGPASEGCLIQVLEKWTDPLPAYQLLYTNRRFAPPAFRLLVDALKQH